MRLASRAYAKEYKVLLHGALTHEVRLGTDIHGNIQRIDNRLERIDTDLGIEERSLAEIHTQLEAAKGEVDRPFPQEQEYADKSARLKELNILLNMDEKEREIIDFKPDETDMAMPLRTPALAMAR